MKMKDKFIIKQDDREPKSLQLLADRLELGIVFERCRLNEGDYVVGDVCIERKTIDDFCLSIMDGRMKRQQKKMRNFVYKFIIISGRISDRTTEIGENCILGMISSLVVGGLNVICVDDDKQLVFLMKRLFERHALRNKENIKLEGGKEK